MSRQEIDERRAFELLRSQSQRSGRKLYDVAEAVVESHLLLVRHEPTA
jgi:AmiR/NasT family two-component response regulator